jgi:hypothetical protein
VKVCIEEVWNGAPEFCILDGKKKVNPVTWAEINDLTDGVRDLTLNDIPFAERSRMSVSIIVP